MTDRLITGGLPTLDCVVNNLGITSLPLVKTEEPWPPATGSTPAQEPMCSAR